MPKKIEKPRKCDMCGKEPAQEFYEDGVSVLLCDACSKMIDEIMVNSKEICDEKV